MFSPLHSTRGYETYVSTNHHGTTKNMALDVEGGRMFAAMEPVSGERMADTTCILFDQTD